MEGFVVSGLQIGIFVGAIVVGILKQSYIGTIKNIGALIDAGLFILCLVMGFWSWSFVLWATLYICVIFGKFIGDAFVNIMTLFLGGFSLYARVFPSPNAFVIARAQMDVHSIDLCGCKIQLLRPGLHTPEKYYKGLDILEDFSVLNDKKDVSLLSYDLLVVGGRKPDEVEYYTVNYQLDSFKDNDLFEFTNAQKAVTDYVYRNIFSQGYNYSQRDGYSVKIINCQVEAGDRPLIRYSLYKRGMRCAEYLHTVVDKNHMLSIKVGVGFDSEKTSVFNDNVIEFLLNDWEVLPPKDSQDNDRKLVGWQSHSWAEIQPPPLVPVEFISQQDFALLLESKAVDPLKWAVFKYSANYEGWFDFQYAAHKELYKQKCHDLFQEKLDKYRITEKLEGQELAND